MYEISCEMCEDLIPLVEDGVASPDSREAVTAHLASCPHCGERQLPDPVPAADEKKILTRLRKMLLLGAVGLVALGAVWGFVITAGFFPGLSVIVALLGLLVVVLFRRARGKGWGRKVLALVCAAGLLLLVDTLCGNPVSQIWAERGAQAYLQEHYPAGDLQVDRVTFNFLTGKYYAVITSPTSEDSHFELYVNRAGQVTWDGYESYVASGMNTRNRLEREYRNLVDPILKKLNLETSAHVAYGDLNLDIDMGLLEVDGDYDIAALGAEQGHLIVTVRDGEVTVERAAELLLLIDSLMTEHGGTFHSIDLSIWPPATEVPSKEPITTLDLEGFLREDISGEGLVDRVREAAVFRTS